METEFRLFPEQASTAAPRVDNVYFFILVVSVFFTALIFVLIVGFALRYHRTVNVDRRIRAHKRTYLAMEIGWSLIPFALMLVMFAWGAREFFFLQQPPPNAIEIDLVAKQWMWKLQHAEGKREIDELHVPVGRPVRLRMISEDVIHSFFVPNFRIKQDVLPGRYTTIWFEATKVGRHRLYCAEYCGTSHSRMVGYINVLEPRDYANWLRGGVREPPARSGEELFTQLRCNTCHSANQPRCPPLEGLHGRMVRLQTGETVVADEEYLRESILNPNAKVVAGYQPIMPSYRGQVSEQGILDLIAYLKTLRGAASDAAAEAAQPEQP